MFDKELTRQQIQGLNDAEAIVAFFAYLGYDTNNRIPQTPANLGITAETIQRQIKRIERIADQQGLLSVYLVEMTSVTVAGIQGILRPLRNRAGQYLLVLTSDYEQIDFVLLQRITPEGNGKGITPKQVGMRPRVLTVDRRDPDPVALRVLRRFSYTEADPLAQFDKILSAYGVAEWSEPLFNNRALFSDYYLNYRLREFPAWKEDPKPAYQKFLNLFAEAPRRWGGKSIQEISRGLLEPAFTLLGFSLKKETKGSEGSPNPHYHLSSLESKNDSLAVCLTYPWGRSLDGKDETRDKDKPNENPGQIVVSLLEKGEAPWAVVTNGKHWRLYSAKAHSRATNYYEIDLEETLSAAEPSEIFRYFWLLFRREAFEIQEIRKEGEERKASFLDQLFEGSEEYARKLGERLKERVFEEIFPHFGKGFIEEIRRKTPDIDRNQELLDQVFQGTLTFLYRLLFLLYAEARDLLPVKEVRGYWENSLAKIKEEIAHVAQKVVDEAPEKLGKSYDKGSTKLFDRLADLFRIIDHGDKALNVPLYNGGLFLTDPDPEDQSPEAENARFLLKHKIPDQFLALGLDLMARDLDEKTLALAFIDYKSLGVRQLGSIYEGLLEFKLRIASEKMAIVKGKKTEEVVLYKDAQKEGRKIVTLGRGKEAKERVYLKGEIYLENDRKERKATGSYYTPDHIVKYIVENAVGPVLKEKFTALAPKLREAQKAYHEAVKAWPVFKYAAGKNPDLVAQRFRGVVDDLFTFRVLDPAMGSGHFLVEAVDFITDRMLDFLNGFPWNPIQTELKKTRETILDEMDRQGVIIDPGRLTDVALMKRHVLKRCIYGVDLNPMAVELAKVSLWLDCFTLGAPLSFLDHHLKCGNSLIGVTVDEVKDAVEPEDKIHAKEKRAVSASEWKEIEISASQFTLFGSRFAGLLLATDLMRHVGELSDVTSAQVQQSRDEYRKASDALAPFRRILDIYTSQWFGNGKTKVGKSRSNVESIALTFLKSPKSEKYLKSGNEKQAREAFLALPADIKKIAATALEAGNEKRYFHWELEFPEVFYGPRPGTTQAVERLEGGGFDAVIGNPPYDEPSQYYTNITEAELLFLGEYDPYKLFKKGRINLFRLFILRGIDKACNNGNVGYIVPMSFLADKFSRSLREYLLKNKRLNCVEAFPQKDDPCRRVFPEAKLSTCIFILTNNNKPCEITIRTHPGRFIEKDSPKYLTTPLELFSLFKYHISIPTVSAKEWLILKQAFMRKDWPRLRDVAKIYVGEVFDNAPNKKYLSNEPIGPLVCRGANIDRYLFREESTQGDSRYLKEMLFKKEKQKSIKLDLMNKARIALQRGAAVDNWRRLIASLIPPGYFCFDTVLLIVPERIDIKVLLALINSDLWEWRFRCTSATNHVNEYDVEEMVIPPCLLNQRSKEHETLKSLVEKILKDPYQFARRSEQQMLPPNSDDFQIDDLIFEIYGLNQGEIAIIRGSIRERE